MYAVHIRSIILTSGLKRVMFYKAWTEYKLNMFYLQIFSSLD